MMSFATAPIISPMSAVQSRLSIATPFADELGLRIDRRRVTCHW
jgi:hypothetical protein